MPGAQYLGETPEQPELDGCLAALVLWPDGQVALTDGVRHPHTGQRMTTLEVIDLLGGVLVDLRTLEVSQRN